MRILFLLLFISLPLKAQINIETHDFSFEYGLAYHTLHGEQKENNTRGRLVSSQNPFWSAAYTYRLGANFGIKFFGGVHFIQFKEPKFGTLVAETKVLNNFGLEIIKKTGPNSKAGLFFMQQDRPLYFAETPTDFLIVRRPFAQAGLHLQAGQRRRIGLLWGLGAKGYTLFPTKGGNLATEGGVGGEAYARLGWVGILGALYQVKGFYQVATAPNAEINFRHELLGYCFQVSYSF